MTGKTVENLWGELPALETLPPPIKILQDQADLLTEVTNSVLQGRVRIYRPSSGERRVAGPSFESLKHELADRQSPVFYATLEIVAPALDSYSVAILETKYELSVYPLQVRSLVEDDDHFCDDDDDFRAAVRLILGSEKTKNLVGILISQSKAITSQIKVVTDPASSRRTLQRALKRAQAGPKPSR